MSEGQAKIGCRQIEPLNSSSLVICGWVLFFEVALKCSIFFGGRNIPCTHTHIHICGCLCVFMCIRVCVHVCVEKYANALPIYILLIRESEDQANEQKQTNIHIRICS